MMEQDREQLCGPKNVSNLARRAYRHGQGPSEVRRVLDQAYGPADAALAKRRLLQLAAALDHTHPGAAASSREGLDETLTLERLGIAGALYRTLRSTNAIENLNGLVGHFVRNVRRWRNGRMLPLDRR